MPSSTKRQVIDWIDQQPWTRPKQTIEIDARDLVGEDWYTNPHGNETPGRHYETFRQAKQISTSEYHRPTITVYLRYPEGVERVREDKWTEMDIGRRIAGCLTDLEVMTRMDMIRVKVLLDPAGASEYTPEGGISSTPFNGVQADVGAILSEIEPGETPESCDDEERPRTEYEEIKAISDTVDLFLDIALKTHGLPSAT